MALVLSTFLFYPLISRGMEITPDGVDYLKTASNVVEGYGFSLGCPPHVHPNRHWPPGYSALIACFLFFGISWIQACKIIAILCYALLLCGISFFIFKLTGSLLSAILSELATGFHPEILRFNGAILSEPLSWLFLIAIVAALTALLMNTRKKWAFILGILLGSSILVRYAYIPLAVICPAIFLFLSSDTPWKKRLYLSICICLPALTIPGLWLIRNLLLFGKIAKTRPPAGRLFENLWDAILSWSDALLQTHYQPYLMILWIVALFLSSTALYFWIRSLSIQDHFNQMVLGCFLLALGYTLGLVLLKTYVTILALDNRKFTQIILLFLLMLVFASARRRKQYVRTISFVLFLSFCTFSIFLGFKLTSQLRSRWLGFFELQSSPTLQDVIGRGLKRRRILSNASDGIWLWTKKCTGSFGDIPKNVRASYFRDHGIKTLVWFKRTPKRVELQAPQDVQWDVPFDRKEFEDGYIYQLRMGPIRNKDLLQKEPTDSFEENEDQ